MIGNYINIDYDKLPKRQVEEEKKEDKDYSSIKKLLSHPQYKDIIGLYRGKSEVKPVMDVMDSGIIGSSSAMPGFGILGAAAAQTSKNLNNSIYGNQGLKMIDSDIQGSSVLPFRDDSKPKSSKKEEPPVLDDVKGKVKPEDLPEGVESAKPVETEEGIDDVQVAREPLLQLLDQFGLSPEDQQAILDILDSGLADLGDDDDVELPENVQAFKLPPDFKKKALNDILKRYPNLGPKILGDDPDSKKNMDILMDILEKYMETKKYKTDRDDHAFNVKDRKAEARRKDAEHDKRAGKIEFHPRENIDKNVTAKDASRSVTRDISRSNKEEDIPESSVLGGSKGKAEEDAARNFERLQRGTKVDTGLPRDKPAPWQTKPGPWD